PETEKHQPDTKHSVYSEKCRVAVYRCSIQTLHIIKGNRWIDHKTEYTGTEHIPERYGYKEINRPFILFYPVGRFGKPDIFPGFNTNQDQRYNLQGAEYCP